MDDKHDKKIERLIERKKNENEALKKILSSINTADREKSSKDKKKKN